MGISGLKRFCVVFESIILFDVVKVITTNHYCAIHLHFGNDTGEDATTNGAFSSEWALFVYIMAFASL